ncbi:hypothetical protein J6590_007869 [Homalodisca vitripennis]|nr:hypothetical protein J6590_007869 [Homalodisca vitripennis]
MTSDTRGQVCDSVKLQALHEAESELECAIDNGREEELGMRILQEMILKGFPSFGRKEEPGLNISDEFAHKRGDESVLSQYKYLYTRGAGFMLSVCNRAEGLTLTGNCFVGFVYHCQYCACCNRRVELFI